MLKKTLERLRKRRQGITSPRLVFYGFVWLVRKLTLGLVEIHYRYIFLQPVPEKPLLRGRLADALETRLLTGEEIVRAFEEDIDGALSRPPKDYPRIKRRAERGDVCIAVDQGSRNVGVLWLTFSSHDETGVRALFVVSPEHGISWDSNGYILEEARGGLPFAALWDGANRVLRERGYRFSACQTSAFNGASLQAHDRLGAFRIGRILYVLVGPLQLTLSNLRPRVSWSGPSGAGPTFVIPPPSSSSASRPAPAQTRTSSGRG